MNPLNRSTAAPHNRNTSLMLCTLLFALCSLLFLNPEVHAMQKPKHIVLLGASVGKAWNIESLPDRLIKSGSSPLAPSASRLAVSQYRFEYIGEYQFDKTKSLQQVLKRKVNKPDAIFIKECAAYFPGDLSHYQELVQGWVTLCRKAGVVPIPTTVVPVIRDDSFKTQLKDLIKQVIGRPTSSWGLTEIIKYNDWIKSYAQKEGLVVLDLEDPVHTSKEDRSLRLDLHSGDGLHLNGKAYKLLDQIVPRTLEQAFKSVRSVR
jgi:hypothetical protein